MVATNTAIVYDEVKIFTIYANQPAKLEKNKCKILITLKETLCSQIAHCKSKNGNLIQFRDDFFWERQQPCEIIQLGVKSIAMSFRWVPRPKKAVRKTRFRQ